MSLWLAVGVHVKVKIPVGKFKIDLDTNVHNNRKRFSKIFLHNLLCTNLVFRSLDPEHALHAEFYKPLFAFLKEGRRRGDADLRVFCANKYFSQARSEIPLLERKLLSHRR